MTIPLLPNDPHDARLRANLKPPGWANPTPAARYQLVVIGAGPAGLVAAAAAAGLGAKVALVERDLMGGDCLTVGCVPSKTLLRAARAAAEVRRAKEFGIRLGEPEIDFAAVMERVRRVRADLSPADSAERFRGLGVDVFLGEAKFVNDNTVEVAGVKLRFGRCLVATGSRPVVPADLPDYGRPRFTNESIFALTELPKRLLVVGGGPIGCELGQAFARLGSRVTLAARGGRLLPREDADAAAVLAGVFRREGVEVVPNPPPAGGGFDAVLTAAGRAPNVGGLDLGKAGVTSDSHDGIRVDRHLRTTNPRVYAAGDVCSLGYRFTHAADATARIVVRNALFPTKAKASALTIPWCTYTDPEVGRVGIAGADDGDVYRLDLRELDRGATDGAEGFVKVVTATGKDCILGATVVGPHAGELAGSFSLAMTHGLGLKELADTVFPYPTYTEALRKLGDQYNRTRLTPFARRLLGGWLRLFR
ncbi:MAG: FAD-dependent oxidoreductase [Gemmataceae bacterium]|nr:FAD-dependent oxidoreductase [Gemmataceae bacterium]